MSNCCLPVQYEFDIQCMGGGGGVDWLSKDLLRILKVYVEYFSE